MAAMPATVAGLLLFTMAYSQDDGIQDWIRMSAGWWADGLISDAEYISSIKWLINEGFIDLDDEVPRLVREGAYSIEHPDGWERQIPIMEEYNASIRDSMIKQDTINDFIPAIISISSGNMLGKNMTEHRTVGLDLIDQYFGDSFEHTRAAETDVIGKPGYVDEYILSVFGVTVQGISYSFEHEGLVYEIKYESGTETFLTHLDEFESLLKTYRLE